jgi:hypothetical protein
MSKRKVARFVDIKPPSSEEEEEAESEGDSGSSGPPVLRRGRAGAVETKEAHRNWELENQLREEEEHGVFPSSMDLCDAFGVWVEHVALDSLGLARYGSSERAIRKTIDRVKGGRWQQLCDEVFPMHPNASCAQLRVSMRSCPYMFVARDDGDRDALTCNACNHPRAAVALVTFSDTELVDPVTERDHELASTCLVRVAVCHAMTHFFDRAGALIRERLGADADSPPENRMELLMADDAWLGALWERYVAVSDKAESLLVVPEAGVRGRGPVLPRPQRESGGQLDESSFQEALRWTRLLDNLPSSRRRQSPRRVPTAPVPSPEPDPEPRPVPRQDMGPEPVPGFIPFRPPPMPVPSRPLPVPVPHVVPSHRLTEAEFRAIAAAVATCVFRDRYIAEDGRGNWAREGLTSIGAYWPDGRVQEGVDVIGQLKLWEINYFNGLIEQCIKNASGAKRRRLMCGHQF